MLYEISQAREEGSIRGEKETEVGAKHGTLKIWSEEFISSLLQCRLLWHLVNPGRIQKPLDPAHSEDSVGWGRGAALETLLHVPELSGHWSFGLLHPLMA